MSSIRTIWTIRDVSGHQRIQSVRQPLHWGLFAYRQLNWRIDPAQRVQVQGA